MSNELDILSYLNDTLSDKDKVLFEDRIKNDPVFKKEVELYKEIKESVLDDDLHFFRLKVKEVVKRKGVAKYNTKVIVWSVITAAACLILSLPLVKTYYSTSVYEKVYTPYSTDLHTRALDASKEERFQLGMLFYERKEFDSAYNIFSNYLLKNFDNQTAKFYLASSALELDRDQEAIEAFTEIIEDGTSPYLLHAKWYLSMAYLKTDNIEEARAITEELAETDNYYRGKAIKLLKRIN